MSDSCQSDDPVRQLPAPHRGQFANIGSLLVGCIVTGDGVICEP